MTKENGEYHGMPHDQLEAKGHEVPPKPGSPRGMVMAGVQPVFAQVKFSGNYGLLCGQYQEFVRTNLTKNAAHQVAWAAFGLCGHQIRYMDASGQVIDEEG